MHGIGDFIMGSTTRRVVIECFKWVIVMATVAAIFIMFCTLGFVAGLFAKTAKTLWYVMDKCQELASKSIDYIFDNYFRSF